MSSEKYTFFNFLEDISKKTPIKIHPYTASQVMLMLSLAEEENILISKKSMVGVTFLLILYGLWQAAYNSKKVFYVSTEYNHQNRHNLIHVIVESIMGTIQHTSTHYRYIFNTPTAPKGGEIVFFHHYSEFQARSSDLIILDELSDKFYGLTDLTSDLKRAKGYIIVCEKQKQLFFEEHFRDIPFVDTYEITESIE